MLFQDKVAAHIAFRDTWRWPNFTIGELSCRCRGRFCQGEYWHDPAFLDALQAMRTEIGRPFVVTSGHRCALWNGAVGGAPLSRHKHVAVDISLHGQDRFALLEAARTHGFRGLGLARSFLHLDRRARPAIWYYGRSKEVWRRS